MSLARSPAGRALAGTAPAAAGPGTPERAAADTPSLRRRRPPALRVYEPVPRHVYVLLALGSLAALFGLWSLLSYGHLVDNLFLPTPTQVWQATASEVDSGVLWSDMGTSVSAIVLGFAVSSVVAVPVGVLMGSFKIAEASLEPAIDFIRYTPAVAYIPLVLIWFGATTAEKIVILFIGIFFQEVLLIMDNVKTTPRQLVDMAYTLGFSTSKIVRKVIFRSALPGIVDTLRISMGWAWTYLVVAELIGAASGLGFRIEQAQRYIDTPEILLNIIVIGLLGVLFDFSFKGIYAVSFRYLGPRSR
jgi:NitT/TauT family transport system permease protein